MICSTCKTANDEAARLCVACGAALSFEGGTPEHSVRGEHDTAEGERDGDPLVGSTIAGKYKIDAIVGAGGMGAVYRATRLLIGDQVAVKILHNEQNDPKAAERFRREAQAAARLKHPNAVKILDFGITEDGLQYLVMDLVDGESLRQIIKHQAPITPSTAAEIISHVCLALDEAHRQNIIHRDIKPDNIIVNPTLSGLRVKVLDFGIAKLRDNAAENLTQSGAILGTPHYMSPEQCLGEELDGRSDIYSLGVVLYEMLCGRVPFNSPMLSAVVVQHVNQRPPPPRALNASIPSEVEDVALHALEKQPGDRPQTAAIFAQELMYAVTGALSAEKPGQHRNAVPLAYLPQSRNKELTVPNAPVPGSYLNSVSSEIAQTVPLGRANVPRGTAMRIPGSIPLTREDRPASVGEPSIETRRGGRRLFLIIAAGVLGIILAGAAVVWLMKGTSTPSSSSLNTESTADTTAYANFEARRAAVDADPQKWLSENVRAGSRPFDSKDPEFLYLYGRALMFTGNYRDAVQAFDLALNNIRTEPKDELPFQTDLRIAYALAAIKVANQAEEVPVIDPRTGQPQKRLVTERDANGNIIRRHEENIVADSRRSASALLGERAAQALDGINSTRSATVDLDPRKWMADSLPIQFGKEGINRAEESKDPEFLYLYGRALMLIGNYREAMKAFELALNNVRVEEKQIVPTNVEIRVAKALAALKETAKTNTTSKEASTTQKAMRSLDEVINVK